MTRNELDSRLEQHWSWGIMAGDVQSWQEAVNLNLIAPMLLTNFFSPSMIEQKVCLPYDIDLGKNSDLCFE